MSGSGQRPDWTARLPAAECSECLPMPGGTSAPGGLEAAALYMGILAIKPDHAEAHFNLAELFFMHGKFRDAALHYERALILQPDRAAAHHKLGAALAAQGKSEAALEQYKRALALNPGHAEAHNGLGAELGAQGRLNDAISQYEQAIAANPDYALAHYNLGALLTAQGKFEAAMTHYTRAIRVRPDFALAHFNRAGVMTFGREDAELNELEMLAARRDLPAASRPYIHFGLAKALEDIGDYARALEHLHKGNESKRRQTGYDEPGVARLFQRISTVFDRRLFERFEGAGDPSTVPIFVLGMPRSGSTLIEQILASHPQIHGAGERSDLETAAQAEFDLRDSVVPFPECVPALDRDALRRMGRTYAARLAALASGEARVVDKLPDNFLRIGLIRLILPNARIIHTVRDPLDTCISCYSQLFVFGQRFSYDLGELGRYYRRYRDLMAHWRSVLPPGAILDVAYEEVVDDIEGQARRLIDYCGLPWDDRCLSFHKTSRPVQTASAVQVRRPLYRSSVKRWRRYEAGLAPLLNELKDILSSHDRVQAGGAAR
ncbi:MAG: sulfotransferase [Bryobacteraceae bacterium]